jgi:hypothetical protein
MAKKKRVLVVKPFHLKTVTTDLHGFGVTDGKKWNITCFKTVEAAQKYIAMGEPWDDEQKLDVNCSYPTPMIPERV